MWYSTCNKINCELIYHCLDQIESLAQSKANFVGFFHPVISRFASVVRGTKFRGYHQLLTTSSPSLRRKKRRCLLLGLDHPFLFLGSGGELQLRYFSLWGRHELHHLGKIPTSFIGSGGRKLSQGNSGNVPFEYSLLRMMIGNDGSEIETMMLAGSIGIRCTSSADEVDKGPLASNIIGRKPLSSVWRIVENVMMDARLAGINYATSKVRSREVSVKKASVEEASVELMSLSLQSTQRQGGRCLSARVRI